MNDKFEQPEFDSFNHRSSTNQPYQPLAAKMRPQSLEKVLGQAHLLAPGKPLHEAISRSNLHSMILWGPPGVGKTSIARMLAEVCEIQFQAISAVLSGVKDIRAAIDTARQQRLSNDIKTLLFVDEVHRFNKNQQDAFLPFVEDGTIIFVGATTENPSFELNNALLSRTRVYKLRAIPIEELVALLERAVLDTVNGLGERELSVPVKLLNQLALAADGDARRALNLLEIAADLANEGVIDVQVIDEVLAGDVRRFDKRGDIFHEQISALHKSVRGSSPDAALYWLARMLDGGCDPLYIARRLIRMATEDIGNADPRALQLALNAWQVQERLGQPEGDLTLAQTVVYLAVAPKSNAVYAAFNTVQEEVAKQPSFEVPLHLRNAPTQLMKQAGYGSDYQYAHNCCDAFVAGENYMPEGLADREYYFPVNRGLEIKIADKLNSLRSLNKQSDFKRYATDPDLAGRSAATPKKD
ncbi:MAG: replication-associated recombination protein A [Pseudomonadales bacterium]|nr:replication-associated recombination protein A [Pseudomonadales bacterium]